MNNLIQMHTDRALTRYACSICGHHTDKIGVGFRIYHTDVDKAYDYDICGDCLDAKQEGTLEARILKRIEEIRKAADHMEATMPRWLELNDWPTNDEVLDFANKSFEDAQIPA